MSRDPGLYLQDILEAVVKIETILLGIDLAAFSGIGASGMWCCTTWK